MLKAVRQLGQLVLVQEEVDQRVGELRDVLGQRAGDAVVPEVQQRELRVPAAARSPR